MCFSMCTFKYKFFYVFLMLSFLSSWCCFVNEVPLIYNLGVFFLTLSSWCSWLCVFNEVPLLYNLNAFFLCCTCGYSWCYFIPEFQRPLELRSVGLWYCFVNKFPFFWNSNNDTSCSDGLFVPYLCLNFHSRFFI